jgi:hypothetical protein
MENALKSFGFGGSVMNFICTEPSLISALKKAASRKLSEEELREQRISFIIGSLDEKSSVTREQVSRVLAEQSGETCDK